MEKRQLIAFSGGPGAGKNSALEIMKYMMPNTEVQEFSFADVPKQILASVFGISLDSMESIKRTPEIKPFNGLSTREVYINFMETMKIHLGRSIWADLALVNIDTADSPNLVMCSDLRFIEEYNELVLFCGIHDYELIVIKMENTNQIQTDVHSEESHSDINTIIPDYTVKAGSLSEIQNGLQKIIKKILGAQNGKNI